VNQIRKLCIFVLITAFALQQTPAFAYTLIPEFLCDLGKQYYSDGRYTDAVQEFRKALILEPGNAVALKYLALIAGNEAASSREFSPAVAGPSVSREAAIAAALNAYDVLPAPVAARKGALSASGPGRQTKLNAKTSPDIISLDENLNSMRMPIELVMNRQLIVRGQNIQRFLITESRILRAEKTGQDELTLTGNDLGYTYVHVWDARNRWTLEILGVPPRPEGVTTLEEELLNITEKNKNFKLRYSVNWQSFESGPDINHLRQSSYSWNHWFALTGPSPYGDIDLQTAMSDVRASTDLTYLTAGLTNGTIGEFNDLNLRLVDFNPGISNLAFSSTALRGAYFNTKAFERRLDYTVFWGKEGGGKYWGLSPSLARPRDSFLDGVEVNFMPQEKQWYSLSAFQGSGSDRQEGLHSSGYDFKTFLGFNQWDYRYETAYDSKTFANLFSAGYHIPDFSINTELRDTDKEFMTMTGTGWRAGQTGALTTAACRPVENLDLSSRLDVYRDKLFPNTDDPNKLNEDFNVEGVYRVDDSCSLHADYTLQNDLGLISPMRSHNAGIGIYKAFGEKRWFNTYATYRHQENTFFNTRLNDSADNKVILGMRFSVIGDLFYYLTHEYNWLLARYYGTRTNPWAIETGFDWNRQIFDSPFYGNFRVAYRNEENTSSPVSFLAGEDYLEWSAELTYRPIPDFETFVSSRLRTTWPESTSTSRRVDLSLYAGLRYTWDTGFRWDTIGAIEGYVFKDDNQDGLRENSEDPVPGVKIKAGKSGEVETDKDGYFYLPEIKGKKCSVSLTTSSLPAGFVATTPVIQEIDIRHGKIAVINFGLTSRTEIWGMIFEDRNDNGKFTPGDKPVKGVIVTLEDGKKAITDGSGRYAFTTIRPGKHKVTLDITSLSSDLLPSVPVYKDVTVSEGASFVYNVPCRRVRQ
jgi:hypothetical protein